VRLVPRRFPHSSRKPLRQLAAGPVIAAAALAAPLEPPRSAETSAAAEGEIRAAIEVWRSAFNARDEQRVCDLFAPDIVANYQGQPERDYASLCEMLRTALQDSAKTYLYSVQISDIAVYGEAAVVRLVWTLEIENAENRKDTIEEPAIDIFHRQTDGSWKITRYLAYTASP
jgi:uncharacterized protein (TIGR02246 family)